MIRFKILPNGRLMDGSVVLEERSGDIDFDRAAWGAVTGSSYPPLPDGFGGPYMELRAVFDDAAPTGKSSEVSGSAPHHDTHQPTDIRVQVGTLRIVSDDLPDSEQRSIVEEYQGRSYPLEELKERIWQNVRDLGYAKASVEIQDTAALPAAPPTHPDDVIVHIAAGARYTLNEIVINGGRSFSDEEVLKQFPLRPGDLFNATAIGEGLDALKHLYASKGYVHLGIIPRMQMNDSFHTVTLVLEINEGKPVPQG